MHGMALELFIPESYNLEFLTYFLIIQILTTEG